MRRAITLLLGITFATAASAQNTALCTNLDVRVTTATYSGCDHELFDVIEAGLCEENATDPVPGPAFLWVSMSRIDAFENGLGGVAFGWEHSFSSTDWSLCTGGTEISQDGWPASGTGNAVTWSGGCYGVPGEVALLGYISLADGASGEVMLRDDPRIGAAQWADCDATLFSMCDASLGSADLVFGVTPRCGEFCITDYVCHRATPIDVGTWGSIKDRFAD